MKESNPKDEYEFSDLSIGGVTFGIKYKATRKSDQNVFCIRQSQKILDVELLQIYFDEFKIHQTLYHKNIVKCFSLFHYSNSLFIFSEFSKEEDFSHFIGKITNEAEIL
jgi:serine/threonine protein kinase